MSHLNKVRKIKDSKKDPTKPDEFELVLKRDWDDRYTSNKLIEKGEGKRNYDQNIKLKKDSKKHGKSGYKLYYDKNSSNFNNKNKIRINSNNIFLNNNIAGGNNESEAISIFDENKLRSIGNNHKSNNRSNNNGEYNFIDNNNYVNLNISDNNNKYNNMSLNELNSQMVSLWDKLGVKDLFKKTFNELKEEMENDDAKKEFMIMEIQNLEIFDKFLKMLCRDIENRENQIHILKRILNIIENQYIDLNIDIDDSILNDFYQTINNYRVITIKVVESITFYNQLFYYFIYKGKFNEEYLMKKYKLLNNEGIYLLKIKNDLNFLGNSRINGYKQLKLNFNSNSDPFLLSVCEQIPINIKDYHKHIKQCQYLIMQGVIFNIINSGSKFDNNINDSNAINNNNESIKNNNLELIKTNNNSKVNNNSNNISNSNKLNINCIDKADNINLKNNNINHVNMKENNIKRKKEKIVIETQLIDTNNYDNFFANKFPNEEQSEEQTLEELKKEFISLKVLKRNKKDSNNRIEIDGGVNEFNNKNSEKKIRKIENNKEEENKEDNNEIKEKEKKNLVNENNKENKDYNNKNKEKEQKEDIKQEDIKENNNKNKEEEQKEDNKEEEIKEDNNKQNKEEEPKENNKKKK